MLVRSLILLSVFFLAVPAALLGTTECTYGPSYWCGSLRNAKQCSAVHHCIQTVWEKQQLPEDTDDICSICKDMVQQARDVLQSNETQEELKQVLEGSCRLIPLREISNECVQLADEFIPELIETLASQMNPQIVCATAGLCNSVRVDRMLRAQGMMPAKTEQKTTVMQAATSPSVQLTDDCQDCHVFVQDTINLVKTHSKEELMDRLLSICGELGSVSDGCSALVEVNIDQIYDFLSNDVQPDDVCNLFGMCGDVFPGAPARQGDEGCDFCVAIAQHWRDELISNTTEQQFREILEGICMQTGAFEDECLSLIDCYYEIAYNFLVNEFDPKHVCEVIGICSDISGKPGWLTLETGDHSPLGKTLPISLDRTALHFVGTDEANAIRLGNRQQEEPVVLPRVKLVPSIKVSVAGESGVLVGGNQACTMCELTLHFIQNELQDKHTREEIEQAVKTVCNKLPDTLNEQCNDYVDAYGDQVIALLQQEIDPSILCPMLGLCPGVASQASLPVSLPAAKPTTDVTCVACEFIMVKVKEILNDKTDQNDVRNALDKVCSLLPHRLAGQCQKFVDENAIEVMQLLAGGVKPEQVCRLLGLCPVDRGHLAPLTPSNQLPVSRLFVPALSPPSSGVPSLENSGQSKVCILCEFALATLEKMMLDNSTEERIEGAVEKVCILLPSTLQEDCLGFVEQYGRALVELIINDVSPAMVCRQLHLCKPPRLDGFPHAIVRRSVYSEQHCLVCRAVVNTYKDASPGTADSSVATFCDTLTDDDKEFCSSIDLSNMSKLLTKHRTSPAVCISLKYCPPRSSLLGSEKCTWGPSYWCQSPLHASSCGLGATTHCQENVWMAAAPAK